MADKSPTENGDDQSSSDIRENESLLDNGNQDQSADDTNDTGSDESQDSGQANDEHQNNGSTQSNAGSDDDDNGLSKFAKAQGIDDLSELSERETRLLKVARDNQRNARNKSKDEVKDELDKTVEEIHQPTPGEEDEDDYIKESRITREEVAQVKAAQKLQAFYSKNEDAEEYAPEMKQILLDEIAKHPDSPERGRAAAQYLASDLKRLLVLAKAERGDNSPDAAREAGRREERAELRRRQEAGGEHGDASSSSSSSTPKLTREAIANMPDEEYAKRRPEIDELMAAGKL